MPQDFELVKRRIWMEIEPILMHAVMGLASEFAIFMFGFGIYLLKRLFGEEKEYFSKLETVDLSAMLAVVAIFAGILVLRVGIRGLRLLANEIAISWGGSNGGLNDQPYPVTEMPANSSMLPTRSSKNALANVSSH